ncbi:MAG: type III-B CRISPR module RAMP protein Cmr4 [Cyanobacteria bacterium P01_E01_bin.42]
MYRKAYGIVHTLAPLHVGASAGEESGNLNLIFRDQFTQTGVIPGSSIRGRLRSEMRNASEEEENLWYGSKAQTGVADSTTESYVKIEYASVLWLPVFCPGQPVVWVSCPRLLQRYRRIAGDRLVTQKNSAGTKEEKRLKEIQIPQPGTRSQTLEPLKIGESKAEKLFFNYGFLNIDAVEDFTPWFPVGGELPAVIVADNEIGLIHDMALYRQSRVKLKDDEKRVDGGQFFNMEALPEDTYLVFPIALRKYVDKEKKEKKWQPFGEQSHGEIYLGGLESIGCGHCHVFLEGVE